MSKKLLTDKENKIVEILGTAWNEFLQLNPIRQDDKDEFRTAIHAAQNIVLSRPAMYINRSATLGEAVYPEEKAE